jgi:glycosyltransferase involved in cell wall biosynthesis
LGKSIFVHPSLCEGFGLPIKEAMAQGVPVCASNKSSLPEIAGEAALYFDPESAPDIARAMEILLQDQALQQQLRLRGFENIKRFSWDASARACAKICLDAEF